MGKKKSFLICFDWEDSLSVLNEKEKGLIFWSLFKYAKYGEMPSFNNRMILGMFNAYRGAIDRDIKKYEAICERNIINGKMGGRPKKSDIEDNINETQITQWDIWEPKKADKDRDKDRDREKDKDKDRDTDINYASSFSAKTVCEYSDDFLKFWKEYPKKVGKGEAYKQWKKVRISSDILNDMLEALKWQKMSDTWKKKSGQYIPNPSTYISQRRWEDEPMGLDSDITDPTRYNDGDELPEYILRGDL